MYPFQSNIYCYCLAGLNGLHVVCPQLFETFESVVIIVSVDEDLLQRPHQCV